MTRRTAAFTELREGFESQYPRPDVPPILFHYTSASALLGILRSNEVWATDLRYMNDYSELTYAEELIQEVLTEFRASTSAPLRDAFVDRAARVANLSRSPFDLFAFCMSEDSDSLTMWRAYATAGAGYAIGFDTETIRNLDPIPDFADYHLARILYDRQEQREHVRFKVSRTFDSLTNEIAAANDPDVAVAEYADFLKLELADELFSFKDPGFKDEHEWRLIHLSRGRVDVHRLRFRESQSNIVPYVDVQLAHATRGKYAGKIPISVVVQGPQTDPQRGKIALEQLFAQGDHPVEIVTSRVPLR